MAENKISHSSRTYDDYQKDLIKLTQQYYPDIFARLDDASIGKWLIDVLSDMGDSLQYHIDRTFLETSIDTASQKSSLLNIARTNGLRISGSKAALCEIEMSCIVPTYENGNLASFDTKYCPVVKRGTLFSSGSVTFELMNDLNFADQFNQDGYSDRKIEPLRNSNGNIIEYKLSKLAVVEAGQSKIYKKVITASDVKPFMEILLKDNNILGIEGILVKKGTNFTTDPQTDEFFGETETYTDRFGNNVQRYFEVDNLIDQERFGVSTETYENGGMSNETYMDLTVDGQSEIITVPVKKCVKGEWKRLKNKFITEFDDDWNLKITFGSGLRNEYGTIPENAEDFTRYMMSKMQANDYMGVLPEAGSTIYILYRVGGGAKSNIATNTLTNIIYNNFEITGNCEDSRSNQRKNRVRSTFSVTNTTPSYGGKDAPTEDEIKYMIKYSNGAQNRCVTLHDYKAKINQLPAKFGCPFRTSVVEENNKVVVYALGLNSEGKLSAPLSETVAHNIVDYLSHYMMINDFIEFRSGKIINIAFNLTVYIDKQYNKSEVARRIIDAVYDYMDIKKHEMGDDIFLGDLTKQITQMDGVIQLSKLKAYNRVGGNYSSDTISQSLVTQGSCNFENEYGEIGTNDDNQIDLDLSDMMLFSESNSMYEIFNKNDDIIVNIKTR